MKKQREIKFRAWDKKERKMYLFDAPFVDCEYNRLSFSCDWNKYNITYGDLIIDNENLVLMQYTGLKDKNGKEIYEGDLLLGRFDVDKVEDWLWLSLTEKQKKTGEIIIEVGIPGVYQNALPDDIEVIGNIYENSELLKEGK